MLTKAWIAILMGLLLGSLLFSSGCGWWGGGYSNNPYYGQPCNCPPVGAAVPVVPFPPPAARLAGAFPLGVARLVPVLER